KPGLEILEGVHGQRVEPLAVHGEHPRGEETGVEGEQARWIGERRLDITPRIAHDERVPVEDLDDALAHVRRPAAAAACPVAVDGGPGRARWNSTSRVGSPSSDTTPRSAALIAFTLPVIMPSNWSLDVRITLSAFALRWETETSPPCIVTNQRSIVVPDVRSIRREPSARRSRSGTLRVSRSKNSSMGSLTIPPGTQGGRAYRTVLGWSVHHPDGMKCACVPRPRVHPVRA